jgi:hypothetical protein
VTDKTILGEIGKLRQMSVAQVTIGRSVRSVMASRPTTVGDRARISS